MYTISARAWFVFALVTLPLLTTGCGSGFKHTNLAADSDDSSTATPAHPTEHTVFQSLLGPMLPVMTTSSLDAIAQKYMADFAAYADQHWTTYGDDWAATDYYDRAKIYYAFYAQTGNAVYLTRANAQAVNYRVNYLEANSYLPSAHWSQMEGIALHFLATGDEASRFAVGQVADLFTSPYYYGALSTGAIDCRIKAHTLDAFLLAAKISAPSVGTAGGLPGGNDWNALAHEAVNRILSSQLPDGTYRTTWDQAMALDGSGPVIKPFMEGMLNHSLISYYMEIEKDPRIVVAIKKNVDALWNLTWDPTAQSFLYNSKETPEEPGSAHVAPDLNNLIVEGFGFVYAMTGDPVYKQRGDAVFAGGVNGAYLTGPKQFNQEYTDSFNYLAFTHPELMTTTGDHTSSWLK